MSNTQKRKTKGGPDPVDVHVGQRLRVRRSLLGMSQEKLADAIGLTFQQIQKYERGTNRISAGRLYQFGRILQIPIAYFYEQYESSEDSLAQGLSDNAQEGFEGPAIAGYRDDVMKRKETLDLVRTYYSIKNQKVRKDMLKLMKSVSLPPLAADDNLEDEE